MTKIILVIIGILLAAVAALMTTYYGGDAFTSSYDEAESTTLINQSVQIDTAFRLFYTEKGRFPGNPDGTGAMNELIDADYLESVPDVPNDRAPQRDWRIDYERGIARSVIGETGNDEAQEVCRKARSKFNLTGDPLSCDDPALTRMDPCCSMNSDEI